MKLYLVFFWFEDINEGYADSSFCDVFNTYEDARAYIGDRNFKDIASEDHLFELDMSSAFDYAQWTIKNRDWSREPAFFTVYEKVLN